jgi:predicted nucleic acid-binding protein
VPLYQIPNIEIDISRAALLLDTNVLVARFYPKDQWHENASEFIDEWDDPFVVPIGVLIEAWGWLVGSRKHREGGEQLLTWVADPGTASLMPQETHYFGEAHDLIKAVYVDCVDALLSCLGNNISRTSFLDTDIVIATYDTQDIYKCRQRGGLRVQILDLRSFDVF